MFIDKSVSDGPLDEDAAAIRRGACHLFAELFGREFPNELRPIGDA